MSDDETKQYDHPLDSVLEDELVFQRIGKTDTGNHLYEINTRGVLLLMSAMSKLREEAES